MFFRMLALLPNEPARQPNIAGHDDQRSEKQKGQREEPASISGIHGFPLSRAREAGDEGGLHGVVTGLRWTGAVTHCKLAASIITRRPNSMPYENPKRIPQQSPGLRRMSYPGCACEVEFNPNGVAARSDSAQIISI